MRRLLPLLGPALVAGVAYLDPGNVASNMTAGARYGYLLVWVVVLANLIAWLVQYLSAKLGIVTGKSLPELLGERFQRNWTRRLYWVQAELVAMATDLAEIIGGAIALELLFGIPLLEGGLITAAVSIALLALHNRSGIRVFERVIIGLLVIIVVGFVIGLFIAPPNPGGFFAGLIPRFADIESVLLATSILGATVMPHAIYAHSGLVRDRFGTMTDIAERSRIIGITRVDVTIALVIAGGVNIAMLILGATTLQGTSGDLSLNEIYAVIGSVLGPVIATFFAVALLASGLASTSVGAYAGAEVMNGLLKVRIPIIWRRIITVIPALVILGFGINPIVALILSQVVLSFGIPFAIIPLIFLTQQKQIMGEHTNRPTVTAIAWMATGFIVLLNMALIILTFTA